MSNKHCIITYDGNKTKIDKIKNIIKMLSMIVVLFKKINDFIDEIQTLILKFNDGIFSFYENIPSVKDVLLKAIETCYLNIQMLFNTSVESIYLLSYTSGDIPLPGLTINYSNTLVHINSFRVLYSKDGIIKIVEYDSNTQPLSVNWIGTHLNKMNEFTFSDRLSKCFNNNLETINAIKVKCLNYIQLINNLQKIIE
jgi:hypothetical protein